MRRSSFDLPRPDPYETLGVAHDATAAQIKTAFRKIALKCHPDKVAGREELYSKVQQAYVILGDEESRKTYDNRIRLSKLRREVSARKSDVAFSPFQFGSLSAGSQPQSGVPAWPRPKADINPSDVEVSEYEVDEAELEKYTSLSSPTLNIVKGIRSRNAKARKNQIEQAASRERFAPQPDPQNDPLKNTSVDEKTHDKDQPVKVRLTTVPPTQLGIRIMNPESTGASVDIIAVHGLGAIPEITWREKISGVNWLSDPAMLPAAVPDARIMRFGYDSLWLGKEPIKTKLSTIANKLLIWLNRYREDVPERPLIFIGHCFGGLVIQRALIIAKLLETENPGILESSVGVVFLGTPHRGSKSFLPQSDLLAAIASQSDLHGDMEAAVLEAMRSDTGAPVDVAEDFASLCRTIGFLITCFFEQRKSTLGAVIGRSDIQQFIVPEESATFDGHPKFGLPLDHFSLNKFPNPDNGNFQDVCGAIVKMYRVALQKLSSGNQSSQNSESAAPADSHNTGGPWLSSKRSFQEKEKEEDMRKIAKEELDHEEAEKIAAAKEEEFEKKYQERLGAELNEREKEKAKAEAKAEQEYQDRLVTNMKKYGVRNPEAIVKRHSLPSNSSLKPHEIKDKMRWYQNRVKSDLLDHLIPDGEVDEILNDTGDTMVIDGIRTTYTKLARKWISTRTLSRYDVPFTIDKDDPSIIIVKRWVPEYEKDFLWDHSYRLRHPQRQSERRGRQRPDPAPPRRPGAANDREKPTPRNSSDYTTAFRERPRFRRSNYESRGSYSHPPESQTRARKDPSNVNYVSRQSSNESFGSPPNTADITKRRQHSRTLSCSPPSPLVQRPPISSNDRPDSRTQRKASFEVRRAPTPSRAEHRWASDSESKPAVRGMRTSRLQKLFGEQSSQPDPTFSDREMKENKDRAAKSERHSKYDLSESDSDAQ